MTRKTYGIIFLAAACSLLLAANSLRTTPGQGEPRGSSGNGSASLKASSAIPLPGRRLATQQETAKQARLEDDKERGKNSDEVLQLQASRGSVDLLLGIAVNCAADILESEGPGTPVEVGVGFRPGDVNTADRRAIIRQGPRGTFVLLAERKRFPLLFDLAGGSLPNQVVTEEQWEAALALAREADLAAGR